MTEQKVIISVRNLKVNFNTYQGVAQVLNNISFDVYEKEVLGLVGETGCGKSVTALSILRLIDYPGEIIEGDPGTGDPDPPGRVQPRRNPQPGGTGGRPGLEIPGLPLPGRLPGG